MSFLSNILALLPDNISKRIKPVDLRNSFEYVYADMAKLQESRILTLGAITATTTTIDLAVHSSGVNSVQLDGEVLSKSTANHWEFAEVTAEEVFIIYATNSTEIFHLAENGMEIPAGALIVATITISETGTSIDEAVSGFREKAIDKWSNLMTDGGDIVLSLHHNQMRYRVSSSANDVRIGGFKNYVTDLLYSGIPLSIKNNTEGDIEFFNAVDASPLFIPIYSADLPFKIKKGETANFAWHTDNGFEIVKTGGGGGASFPDGGVAGNILEFDPVDGAKWSGRLTDVENNKLDKTTTTVAAPDASFKYVYLTDETNNVRRMLAGDLGKNIANSNLTSVAGAGLTLGSSWTLNTNGQLYSVTNLPDKSADASFNRMLVQNSTGQVAWGNGANMLITGMTAMSDLQKDSWRLANRKTNENYSLGQPRIDLVNPPILSNSESHIQYISLVGINLFVDNVTSNASVTMKNEVTGVEYPISNIQVFQSNPNILSFGLDWSQYPVGIYSFKVVHNSLTSIVNTQNTLQVTSTINPSIVSPFSWTALTQDDSALGTKVTLGETSLIMINQENTTDKFFKTNNAVITKDEINAGVIIYFNVLMRTLDIDNRDSGYNSYNIGFENINIPLAKTDVFNFGINIGPSWQTSVPFTKVLRSGNIVGGFNNYHSRLDFNDILFFMLKGGNLTMGIIGLGIIFSTTLDFTSLTDLGLKITAKNSYKKDFSINVLKKYLLS